MSGSGVNLIKNVVNFIFKMSKGVTVTLSCPSIHPSIHPLNYTYECIPGKELHIWVYTREGITHKSVYQGRNYPYKCIPEKELPRWCISGKELPIWVYTMERITDISVRQGRNYMYTHVSFVYFQWHKIRDVYSIPR